MIPQHSVALNEIGGVLDAIAPGAIDTALDFIVRANKILLYGCGREGLQMRGLAMRLHHLGLNAGMVGDMNASALGAGDLFIVSAGPGELATVTALMNVARRDGAAVLFLTAVPNAAAAQIADYTMVIPAQTMASDQAERATSVLPMGSLYEAAMFVLFELVILRLQDRLGVANSEMRARHTNME